MSYSIWLTSYWYTFWKSPENWADENRNTASFCIRTLMADDLEFTAEMLRASRATCLKIAREHYPSAIEEDIVELNSYMDDFIKDVDKTYPKT